MEDWAVVALFGAIFLVPIVGVALGWTLGAHYREKGALVHDTFTPGRPCRLELPASGPLDVMVRFATTKARGQQESLTATVEVRRGEPSAIDTRFAVGLSASGPKPAGYSFTGTDGTSFAISKMGRTSTRTKVLGRIPGGGPGHVVVDLLAPGADVGYCAAFVKPAKA